MRKATYKNLVINLSVLSILLIGCQKQQLELIKGRWNKELYFNNLAYEEIWAFDSNSSSDVYRIRYYPNTGITDTISTGTYSIKNNTLSIAGANEWPGDFPWFKGDFKIDRLDEDLLIIYRKAPGSGTEYQEFAKQ